MNEPNKYFTSTSAELMRSQIRPADYNPRQITAEGRKALKKSIKLYGVVGGIVVNKRTGYTIVGGHQKVSVLDDLNKYDERTKEGDYILRVELIDVDEKKEKELNVTLNNPNVGGDWDYDALRELLPSINYQDVGFTEVDLNLIGCDYYLRTDTETLTADAFSDLLAPIKEAKRTNREAEKALQEAQNIERIKSLKEGVREGAEAKAKDMHAYVMLSFDSIEDKGAFCERFGYDPYTKVIKGEVFGEQVERVD